MSGPCSARPSDAGAAGRSALPTIAVRSPARATGRVPGTVRRRARAPRTGPEGLERWQRIVVAAAATGTIGTSSIMGLSISSVTTSLLAIGAVAFLFRARFRHGETVLLTFVAIVCAAAALGSNQLTVFSVQQLAVLVILVAGAKAAADGRFASCADEALLLLAGVNALSGGAAVASNALGLSDLDTRMFGLIGTIAYMTARRSQHEHPGVLLLALAGVAFSGSRTSVAAIVAFEVLQLILPDRRRPGAARRTRNNLIVVALLGAAALFLRFSWGQRFAEQGDNVSVGGATINTNGRRDLWRALTDDMGDSLLVGDGVGASSAKSLEATDGVLSLPHNEFLRLAFDFGVIFSVLIWALVLLYFRRARCPVSAIVPIAILCLFDNVYVYLGCTVATVILLAVTARDASLRPPRVRRRSFSFEASQQMYLHGTHVRVRRSSAGRRWPGSFLGRASLSGLDQLIMASSNALFFLLLTREASPASLSRLAPAFLILTLAIALTRALAGEPQLLDSYGMVLGQARRCALFFGVVAAAALAPTLAVSSASFDVEFWAAHGLLVIAAAAFESERYLALRQGRYSRLLAAECTWAAALLLPPAVASYGDTETSLVLYAGGAIAAQLLLVRCPDRVIGDGAWVGWRRLLPLLGAMGGMVVLLHVPLLLVSVVVGQQDLATLRLLQAALNPFVTIAGMFGFVALATRVRPGTPHMLAAWLVVSSGIIVLLFGPSMMLDGLLGADGAELVIEARVPATFFFSASVLLALVSFPLRQLGAPALLELRAQNWMFFAGGVVGVTFIAVSGDLTLSRFLATQGCILLFDAAMSFVLLASARRRMSGREDPSLVAGRSV